MADLPGSQAAEWIVTGAWMAPGALQKLHRQLERRRTHTSRGAACDSCRRVKRACDGGTPCRRCVQKGLNCQRLSKDAAETLPAQTAAAQDNCMELSVRATKACSVERPVSRKGILMLNERGNPFLQQRAWNHVCPLHWICGHPEEGIVTSDLPDVLVPIASAAIAAARVLMAQNQPPQLEGAPSHLNQAIAHRGDDTFASDKMDPPGKAVLRVWADKSARVRERVSVSDHFAALVGTHPEELCARVGNHEVPTPRTGVDAFCSVLDCVLNGMDPCSTRYVKWRKRFLEGTDSTEYMFIRNTKQNKVEHTDREKWEFELHVEAVSVEEYEAVRRSSPHICRPLTHLLGDDRPAHELLRYDARWDSWAGIMEAEGGMERLQRFAEALGRQFAPAIRMAEQKAGCSIEALMGPVARSFRPERSWPYTHSELPASLHTPDLSPPPLSPLNPSPSASPSSSSAEPCPSVSHHAGEPPSCYPDPFDLHSASREDVWFPSDQGLMWATG